MQEIIAAIEKSLQDRNYYAALFLTITIPSICCALESDGTDNRIKYINWYNRYINHNMFKGENCYDLRCSLLHQARTWRGSPSSGENQSPYSPLRVMFTAPPPTNIPSSLLPRYDHHIHNVYFENNGEAQGERAIQFDISEFCHLFLVAIQAWLKDINNDNNYKRNLENVIRTRPNGLTPHIIGVPIIT